MHLRLACYWGEVSRTLLLETMNGRSIVPVGRVGLFLVHLQ
jgi:hypothetical protein